MADKRFFKLAGPFTIGELAAITGAEISVPVAASKVIVDVAPLQDAGGEHAGFFDNKKYLDIFKATKAGVCFVRPDVVGVAPANTVCLVTKNPYMAYAQAAHAFYPGLKPQGFVAASSVIDVSATVGADTHIGANVVIGADVTIGNRCFIHPNAVIETGVTIGDDVEIGGNAFISHALIGNRVKIYPGACIGRPGFGFAMGPAGFLSVPQLGRVIIEDDVEIGANSTIDRGAGPDTVIGQGTRIDNLVQIGHNVKIGRNCVMVSQSGVSGSSEVGDFSMIGGQAGIAGHLNIGSGARIAAQSGVMRDVEPKGEVMGTPAVPLKQFMRQIAYVSRLIKSKKGDTSQ